MSNISAFGITDTGKQRERNEDNYYSSAETHPDLSQQYGYLFVVCDGVGGNRGGEVASRLACDQIPNHFYKHTQQPLLQRLTDAVNLADHDLKNYSSANPDYAEMSCTVVAFAIVGKEAAVSHMGDTRLYRLRDDKLQQITRDHSWVQQQIDQNVLTQEEAEKHPNRNVILRSLGGPEKHTVETQPVNIAQGDRFLLASDGLTGPVPALNIHHYVRQNETLTKIGQVLIKNANDNGGPDNISAVLIQLGQYKPPADVIARQRQVSKTTGGQGVAVRPAAKKDRNQILLYGIVGAAVLTIGIVLGLFFFNQNSEPNVPITTNNQTPSESGTGDTAMEETTDGMMQVDSESSEVEMETAEATSTIGSPPEESVASTTTDQQVQVNSEPETTTEAAPENVAPTIQATAAPPPTEAPAAPAISLDIGLDCPRGPHNFSSGAEIPFQWTGPTNEEVDQNGGLFLVVRQGGNEIGWRRVSTGENQNKTTPGEWLYINTPSSFNANENGEYRWLIEYRAGTDRNATIINQSLENCFTVSNGGGGGSQNGSGGGSQNGGGGRPDPTDGQDG